MNGSERCQQLLGRSAVPIVCLKQIWETDLVVGAHAVLSTVLTQDWSFHRLTEFILCVNSFLLNSAFLRYISYGSRYLQNKKNKKAYLSLLNSVTILILHGKGTNISRLSTYMYAAMKIEHGFNWSYTSLYWSQP